MLLRRCARAASVGTPSRVLLGLSRVPVGTQESVRPSAVPTTRYVRGPPHDGVPTWVHGEVRLLRWAMSSGKRWWYFTGQL
jgi:hypothetical protein